jgi:hypothetical protein
LRLIKLLPKDRVRVVCRQRRLMAQSENSPGLGI